MENDESQDFSGTADEFLSLRTEDGGDDSIPTPDDEPQAQTADSADAADDPEAEDDDLSPAERVAAVLAQDGVVSEPDAEAEPAAVAAEDGDIPEDLSKLSPEELLKLAQEALDLRAKLAEGDVDREQQELEAEIADLDGQTAQRVRAAYQREVTDLSNQHYGAELDKARRELRKAAEAQREVDPQAFEDHYWPAVARNIMNHQREWEAKKAAEWEPVFEAEVAAARKQNPKLRKRYAEHLAAEHNLPKRAVDELLKVQNTDDMPVVAQSLADSVRAHASQKRQSNQQQREQAARETAKHPIASPTSGRAKPPKPVEYKGEAEEFLAMKKQGLLSTV